MNKLMEILIGLILVVVPVWSAISYSSWGSATITVLKGSIILGLIMIGLLFLMLGISDLKD